MSKAELLRLGGGALLVWASLVSTGCRQDMHDQPKLEPLEASSLFGNGAGSRPLVAGTVARGMLRDDEVFFTGRTPEDEFVAELPVALTRDLLERGRSRFDAFCSPCHGRIGYGDGMVVQRGFKQPKSFHELRLRQSPVGYFYHVVTNGFGQMSNYAAQIPPADRWAIAAYIRALQLSQNTAIDQLSAEELAKLSAQTEATAAAPAEAH